MRTIQEQAKQSASGEPDDSLRCVFPRTLLPASGGTVSIRITETLPHSMKDLSAEEHTMVFSIRTKR